MIEWERFWALFHRRWGSDHESSEYVKQEWKELQAMMETLERWWTK